MDNLEGNYRVTGFDDASRRYRSYRWEGRHPLYTCRFTGRYLAGQPLYAPHSKRATVMLAPNTMVKPSPRVYDHNVAWTDGSVRALRQSVEAGVSLILPGYDFRDTR